MHNGTTDPSSAERTSPRRRDLVVHRLLTWGVFATIVLTGAAVIARHPVEYATSGAVVFVGSETAAERAARTQTDIDPSTQSVLSRFGNPTVVADMMARVFQSPAKQEELRSKGLQGRLQVTTKTNITSQTPDHGPVMVFTVFGADPTSTRHDVKLAMSELPKELASWQQGADPNLSVSQATVLGPKDGVRESGSKIRAAVGVVVSAALIAWLLGLAHSTWLRRADRRRHRDGITSDERGRGTGVAADTSDVPAWSGG